MTTLHLIHNFGSFDVTLKVKNKWGEVLTYRKFHTSFVIGETLKILEEYNIDEFKYVLEYEIHKILEKIDPNIWVVFKYGD